MRYTIIFIYLIFSLVTTGQNYTVTKVIGVVYFNNKLIQKGDVVTDISKLVATSKTAAIRLLNADLGSIPISFISGEKTISNNVSKHSELYEVIVQTYINKYTTSKSMKTRAGSFEDFDWYKFFNTTDNSSDKNSFLIIQNQAIPVFSRANPVQAPFQLFCTIYNSKDSIEAKLPIQNDSIYFIIPSFKHDQQFSFRIKLTVPSKTGDLQVYNIQNNRSIGYYMTNDQLDKIMYLFYSDWEKNYSSKKAAIIDFYDYLNFNYGKFYMPLINSKIKNYFQ